MIQGRITTGGLLLRVGLEIVEVAGCKERSGSLSGSSLWKRARVLTISFENSRGPQSPRTTGTTNGFQRREQTAWKLIRSRAAAWPSESHTTPQKPVQSHAKSISLMMDSWALADEDSSPLCSGTLSSRGNRSTIGRG